MFLRSAYLACAALTLSTLTTSAPTSNNNVLYTLDNNQKGASIVALELSKNGTIVASHLTSTGGMGSSGKSPAGSPAIGSLFSNNAVVVSGNVCVNRVLPVSLTNHCAASVHCKCWLKHGLDVCYRPSIPYDSKTGWKTGLYSWRVSRVSGIFSSAEKR